MLIKTSVFTLEQTRDCVVYNAHRFDRLPGLFLLFEPCSLLGAPKLLIVIVKFHRCLDMKACPRHLLILSLGPTPVLLLLFGGQLIRRVRYKLGEIGIDLFWQFLPPLEPRLTLKNAPKI